MMMMPRPGLRSSSRKPQHVRLPGGRTTVHYEKKKVGYAVCMICGRKLGGVPRLRPSEISKLPKSSRRPERPCGGRICHECLMEFLKREARRIG